MIDVEIWSDFACPFCYIGKRNFELALQDSPLADQVRVSYRSFELDPSAPQSQEKSIHEVLAQKYQRSKDWALQMNERVTQMAAEVGLNYQMDRVIPTNSLNAHRLSHLAGQKNLQSEAQEALFSAYFTEGLDIADGPTLREIGARIGLAPESIEKMLRTDSFLEDVRNDEEEARALGIQGVPFFLINRKWAVSGAQPIAVFKKALEQASGNS